jgi:uncharacterized membrane protein
MQETLRERHIRAYFQISVILKGLISLAEMLGGILVLIIPPAIITGAIITLSQSELSQEPGDFIATHALQLAEHFSLASGTLIAVYLLSRGLIKLGLVVALLKNQLWAYPASLAVLGLFMLYQTYEIITTHSLLMVVLTLFDLLVVYLIWSEYLIVRERVQGTTLQTQ